MTPSPLFLQQAQMAVTKAVDDLKWTKAQKDEDLDTELPMLVVEDRRRALTWAREAAAFQAAINQMVACVHAVLARIPGISFKWSEAVFDSDFFELHNEFDFWCAAMKDNPEKHHRSFMVVGHPGDTRLYANADGDPQIETEEHLRVPCAWYAALLAELMLEFGKFNATKPQYPIDITGLRRTYNIANGDLAYGDFQD